ncbi:hypothetical protein BBJ28_00023652, partial [Nothophytophthora sp. Chile5]
ASLLDADARQYVSGVGVHWYKNLDFAFGTTGDFDDLSAFHEDYPDVFILATEACEGSLVEGLGTGVGTDLLDSNTTWQRGENYARDIINDLASFASGWTDWNLVLNTTGGPNWADNQVDAPILVDEEGGAEFYKQPMYYVMGHFSKFLVPGSLQVALNVSTDASSALENVDRVAFRTPDDRLVLVLSNRDSTEKSIRLSFTAEERSLEVTLPANAVQTILLPALGGNSSDAEDSSGSARSSASMLARTSSYFPVAGLSLLMGYLSTW